VAGTRGAGRGPAPTRATGARRAGGTYALMLTVERYESLAEDMEELGVVSLDDVRRKIAELHELIDATPEPDQ
jgi:hypothetical protein